MFITSIYLYLNGAGRELEKGALNKMNEAMQLAHDVDALVLPAQLYHLLWDEHLDQVIRGCYKQSICTDEPTDLIGIVEACSNLVRAAPRWLHYGSESDMVQDVMRVFKNVQEQRENPLLQAA